MIIIIVIINIYNSITISKTYNNDYNKKNYDIDISDKLTRNSFYDNENNNGDVITVIDDDIDNYQHANSKLDDNDSNETIMKITSSNIRSNLIDESMNNNSIILLSEHDDYFTTTTTLSVSYYYICIHIFLIYKKNNQSITQSNKQLINQSMNH